MGNYNDSLSRHFSAPGRFPGLFFCIFCFKKQCKLQIPLLDSLESEYIMDKGANKVRLKAMPDLPENIIREHNGKSG